MLKKWMKTTVIGLQTGILEELNGAQQRIMLEKVFTRTDTKEAGKSFMNSATTINMHKNSNYKINLAT